VSPYGKHGKDLHRLTRSEMNEFILLISYLPETEYDFFGVTSRCYFRFIFYLCH